MGPPATSAGCDPSYRSDPKAVIAQRYRGFLNVRAGCHNSFLNLAVRLPALRRFLSRLPSIFRSAIGAVPFANIHINVLSQFWPVPARDK
jgi:hypothetical protein